MNAKKLNDSHRSLFLDGGRLDILWAYDEANDERNFIKFGKGLELIEECPCGCGLKNEICPDRIETMKRTNGEIPF